MQDFAVIQRGRDPCDSAARSFSSCAKRRVENVRHAHWPRFPRDKIDRKEGCSWMFLDVLGASRKSLQLPDA